MRIEVNSKSKIQLLTLVSPGENVEIGLVLSITEDMEAEQINHIDLILPYETFINIQNAIQIKVTEYEKELSEHG